MTTEYQPSLRAKLEDKEREIAELKEQIEGLIDSGSAAITALKAHINDLREDFRKIRSCYGDGYEVDNIARQALSKTPAQSLQAHNNEVIEMCAEELEERGCRFESEVIRALKGK